MSIIRLYYRYKWYSQAARTLQHDLPSFSDTAALQTAQENYNIWLQYYAYVKAEHCGRVSFRDQYVPVEKQDSPHEHEIKRCNVATSLAYSQLCRWAGYITYLGSQPRLPKGNPKEVKDESINDRANHTPPHNTKKKPRRHTLRKPVEQPSYKTQDIEAVIMEIQTEAEQLEIQGCIDVAELILNICPVFCARDESVITILIS